MKHYKIVPVFAVILLLLFLLTGDSKLAKPRNPESKNSIAVVLYEEQRVSKMLLLQGVRQACKELGLEETVLSAAYPNEGAEQIGLLKKEQSNGANGVLIVVADSALQHKDLLQISGELPIIAVENGANGAVPVVSADNFEMGALLASKVAFSAEDSIVIIEPNPKSESSTAQIEGFTDKLGSHASLVTRWTYTAKPLFEEEFQQLLDEKEPTIIIALEKLDIEAVADAIYDLEDPPKLYGIGSSNKVIHYINNNTIKGIVHQDEFSIGYQSVYRLARNMGLDATNPNKPISIYYINSENLYDPYIQHLLFPIM